MRIVIIHSITLPGVFSISVESSSQFNEATMKVEAFLRDKMFVPLWLITEYHCIEQWHWQMCSCLIQRFRQVDTSCTRMTYLCIASSLSSCRRFICLIRLTTVTSSLLRNLSWRSPHARGHHPLLCCRHIHTWSIRGFLSQTLLSCCMKECSCVSLPHWLPFFELFRYRHEHRVPHLWDDRQVILVDWEDDHSHLGDQKAPWFEQRLEIWCSRSGNQRNLSSRTIWDCCGFAFTTGWFWKLLKVNVFRRIWNVQEKSFIQYSVQWGQNSFFFQCKTANFFYSTINDSSKVRTTAFSSSRLAIRVTVVPNIFTTYP